MKLKHLYISCFIALFITFSSFSQKPYFEISKKIGITNTNKNSSFYNGEIYEVSFFMSNNDIILKLTIRNTSGILRYDHDFNIGTSTTGLGMNAGFFKIENGNVYISGNITNTSNLYVTQNQNLQNNYNSFLIYVSQQTINSNSNSIDYFAFITGDELSSVYVNNILYNRTLLNEMAVENGNVYFLFTTTNQNIYTSNNSTKNGDEDSYIVKISENCIANNLNFQNDASSFASYFGSIGYNYDYTLKVSNGNLYFLSYEFDSLATHNYIYKIKKNAIDNHLLLTNPTSYGSYEITNQIDYYIGNFQVHNDSIYIVGSINSVQIDQVTVGSSSSIYYDGYLICLSQAEIDANLNQAHYFSLINQNGNFSEDVYNLAFFENNIYAIGYVSDDYGYISNIKKIPTSVIHLNQNILTSSSVTSLNIGDLTNNNLNYNYTLVNDIIVNEKGIHVIGSTSSTTPFNYPTTNGTTIENSDFYLNFCLNGAINYASTMGSWVSKIHFFENNIYTYSEQYASDVSHNIYTLPIAHENLQPTTNFLYSKLTFDTISNAIFDTILPESQEVCAFGTADLILGSVTTTLNQVIPEILEVNGGEHAQYVNANYYWEQATTPTGPWSRIPGAGLKDYLPIVTNSDAYYRRTSFFKDCGDTVLLDVSTISSVIINEFIAPTVDAGGSFHTCPDVPITLGGNPSASGGLAPYQYSWDNNLGNVSNPIYNSESSAILTLTVTDANGCRKVDQATVYLHQANAGNDKSVCDGEAASIGTMPIQGLTNISYSWLPIQFLTCSNCAQTDANPTIETTYNLTMTLINSDGNLCSTSDDVLISVASSPSNPNFAGEDVTICYGTPVNIGTPSEDGYSYQWFLYSSIADYTSPETTFSYIQPFSDLSPNPHIKYLMASINGCDFVDEIAISVIKANAGSDVCGPYTIGTVDITPNLDETYLWTKISGPADFTGPTDQPLASVSASIGGVSVFELTVSLNGVSCTDQVLVVECVPSSGPSCNISNNSSSICPSNLLNNFDIQLNAGVNSTSPSLQYAWTPQNGLSNYDSQTVTLLSNTSQTYTVTITDANDPNFSCISTVEVNNPNWTLPVVEVLDTTACKNDSIFIGSDVNPNYSYLWTLNGSPFSNESNPQITLTSEGTINYALKVTDNVNHCVFNTISNIIVNSVDFIATADWYVCSNVIIELGNEANQNLNHTWEPANAPWQNGTTNTDANPEVILTTSTTFYNTMSSSNGCSDIDTVNVIIDQFPTLLNLQSKYMCFGTDSTQIGNPAINGLTYSWFPPTGLSCSDCAQPMVSLPSSQTFYTLTVDLEGGCGVPSTQNMFVERSNNPISIPDITYCPSDGPINLADNISSLNYQYFNWSPSNLVSNSLIFNPSTNVMDTTIFYLTLRDSRFCVYVDTILVTPMIASASAGSDQTMCIEDGSIIIGDENSTGNLSWSPISNITSINSATTTFTPTSSGVFQYVLTNTNGSCSATDMMQITVNGIITEPFTNKFVCSNSCTEIGVSSNPNYTYSWFPISGLDDPTISNPMACVNQETNYTVTISSINGCTLTENIMLSLSDSIAPSIILPSLSVCDDSLSVFINGSIVPTTGNYAYSWNPTIGLSNPTSLQTNLLTTFASQNEYELTITNLDNNCSSEATLNVDVVDCSIITPCDIPFVITVNSDSICTGNNFTLNLSSDSSNVTYQWDANGILSSGYSDGFGNQISQNLNTTSNSNGQVIYTITPSIGTCIGDVQTFTVVVIPNPTVSISGSSNYCENDSTMLYTNDNYNTYSWSNGDIDTSSYFTINDNPISLTVTNDFGCSNTSNPLNLTVDLISSYFDTLTICQGDSILIFSQFEYNSGNYFQVFQGNLCDSIVNVHLIVNPLINYQFLSSSDTVCEGEIANNVMLSVNGTPPYSVTYTLNGVIQNVQSNSNPISLGNQVGTYVMQSISDFQCINSITDTFSILEFPAINANVLTNSEMNCGPFLVNLLTDSNTSNCAWTLNGVTYSECQTSVLLQDVGCYDLTLQITDENSCSSTIFNDNYFCVLETPISNFSISPSSELWVNSTVIFDNNSLNATNYIWDFDNGANPIFTNEENSQSIQFTNANDYQIMLIAINEQTGCMDTSFQLISINSYDDINNCNSNVFSPNNDNINDYFYLDFCGLNVADVKIIILNRWGNLMAEIKENYNSDNPASYWNGTSNGKECSEGTYFYVYEITTYSGTKITNHGYLTLIK